MTFRTHKTAASDKNYKGQYLKNICYKPTYIIPHTPPSPEHRERAGGGRELDWPKPLAEAAAKLPKK